MALIVGTDPVLFRVLRPISNSRTDKRGGGQKRLSHIKIDEHEDENNPSSNGQVLVDRALCFSLRHGRNDVESVRRDVEFGIVLLYTPATTNQLTLADIHRHPPEISTDAAAFDDWAPGDVVQCFRIVQRSQPLDWHIDHSPTPNVNPA